MSDFLEELTEKLKTKYILDILSVDGVYLHFELVRADQFENNLSIKQYGLTVERIMHISLLDREDIAYFLKRMKAFHICDNLFAKTPYSTKLLEVLYSQYLFENNLYPKQFSDWYNSLDNSTVRALESSEFVRFVLPTDGMNKEQPISKSVDEPVAESTVDNIAFNMWFENKVKIVPDSTPVKKDTYNHYKTFAMKNKLEYVKLTDFYTFMEEMGVQETKDDERRSAFDSIELLD